MKTETCTLYSTVWVKKVFIL